MKIAINKCYGDFDPSAEVEVDYLRRKGKQAFFYKQVSYKWQDDEEKYLRVPFEKLDGHSLYHTVTKDLGEVVNGLPNDDSYFYMGGVKRDDPDLIAALENCKGKTGTRVSEIVIVEIPDGVNWEIDDYDGMESIHEVHRTWG